MDETIRSELEAWKSRANPRCKLIGENGNAFAIMGAVLRCMRNNAAPQSLIDQFKKDSMSGDYDNLLRTAMEYVEVI